MRYMEVDWVGGCGGGGRERERKEKMWRDWVSGCAEEGIEEGNLVYGVKRKEGTEEGKGRDS